MVGGLIWVADHEVTKCLAPTPEQVRRLESGKCSLFLALLWPSYSLSMALLWFGGLVGPKNILSYYGQIVESSCKATWSSQNKDICSYFCFLGWIPAQLLCNAICP